MNTFGRKLRLTTFGESHGVAIGGVIDGFPPLFKIDFEKIDAAIAERRPGRSALTTSRKESDRPEFLSGLTAEGVTLGTPIGFIIRNQDQRSGDYEEMKDIYRPSHADYTYEKRYGIRDYRGGGRASARETANWVVGGAFAMQWLETKGIEISACLSKVGKIGDNNLYQSLSLKTEQSHPIEVSPNLRREMEQTILEARKKGDSIGGVVTCLITGMPAGIGNPVADKLQARLAMAMLSINAAKGFDYGYGFKISEASGTEVADKFAEGKPENLKTSSNYSGGIQGGITNGMPIFFNVAFKPTPTVMQPLDTVNTSGHPTILKAAGRHDPCVAVRAVPVVKAMAALVVADFLL